MSKEPKYFVIGDVHGCAYTMENLVARAPEGHRIVLLGDYVDRGNNIVEAVSMVRKWVEADQVIALKGNHEDMMARSILDGNTRQSQLWQSEGGAKTMDDYRADNKRLVDDAVFLDGLPTHHEDGVYLFSHAGVPPDMSIGEAITTGQIFWNRGWLSDQWQQVVGHTPKKEPEIRFDEYAIIDTGAVTYGTLTAIALPSWDIFKERLDKRDKMD